MTILSKTERNMRDYGVHWFKFDEPSGNITDSKGSAVGTISGGVTRVFGWNGQGSALNFDGNSQVSINTKIPFGKKSIRLKFKLDDITSRQTLISNYVTSSNSTSNGNGMYIQILDKKIYIRMSVNTFENYYTFASKEELATNIWYDLLVRWDGTINNPMEILLDGQLIGNLSINSLETIVYSGNIFLGRTGHPAQAYYYSLMGQIDELEIYTEVIYPYDNQVLLSKEANKVFSIKETKIVEPDNQNEQTFIRHGIDANYHDVAASTIYNGLTNIVTQSHSLGEGKTFTHNIDLNKWRGRKIVL